MGTSRKMSHSAPKIALFDAHMSVNGCQVFLGHPDSKKAQAAAAIFKDQLGKTIVRAKSVNLHDMYEASFGIRERVESGEFN